MKAYEVLEEKSFYVPRIQIVEENIIEYEATANELLKELGLNIVLDARRNKKPNGTLEPHLQRRKQKKSRISWNGSRKPWFT